MHNHSEKFEPKKAIIVTIIFILFLVFASIVSRNKKLDSISSNNISTTTESQK